MDFVTNLTKKQRKRRRYFEKLLKNDLGKFFDIAYCGSCPQPQAKEVFCRIIRIVADKKHDLVKMIPVVVNYFQIVAQLIANEVVDLGLPFQWTDDENSEAKQLFEEWWKEIEGDEKLREHLKLIMATGYGGTRILLDEDSQGQQMVKLDYFDYHQFYKGRGDDVYFRTLLKMGKGYEEKEYVYLISVEKNVFGRYQTRHQIFKRDKSKENEMGDEVPEMIEVFFPDATLTPEGYETITMQEKPYHLVHTGTMGFDGEYESIFYKSMDKMAAASLLATFALLEYQTNYLSRMVAPRSMFSVKKGQAYSAGISNNQFHYVNDKDEAGILRYIQKDIANNFGPLMDMMKWLSHQVAFEQNVPADQLEVESGGGQRTVEGIKRRMRPFVQNVNSWRSKTEDWFKKIVASWCEMNNVPAFEFTLNWAPVGVDLSIDEKNFLFQELQANAISLKEYHRNIRTRHTEQQINEIIEERDAEQVSIGVQIESEQQTQQQDEFIDNQLSGIV